MFNVIRMEINRLFRSKSLYVTWGVCAGVVVLFVMFLAALLDFTADLTDYSDMAVSAGDMAVSAGDVYGEMTVSGSDAAAMPAPSPISFFASVVSGLCLLFVVIYTASFVHAFYKDGYSKNVIACVKYRYYFQISKTVCVAAIAASFLVVSSVAATLASVICVKGFTFTHMGLYFAFLLGEFLLLAAVGLLSAFLTELTGGKATAIVYILLAMTNLVSGILSLLDSRLSRLLHIDVELSDLLPSLYHNSFTISAETPSENGASLAHAIILSIVFIAIYNAAGAYLITKRDVK